MLRPDRGYTKSKSIDCPLCGARAQFIRRLPDMARSGGELKAYVCVACHKETEIAAI